ncbi:MAG: hypothetical protein HUJ56_09025 [Erysipelotrichaceae bacterium]|nr:hypothetical protein [Erysipelotrichaceae bacterium]
MGNGHKCAGKPYCRHCYEELLEEIRIEEEAKEQVYQYIRDLFVRDECPPDVVRAIDNALKNNKTLSGIRGTLYYYYERMGNSTSNIHTVTRVIEDEYENARKYFARQREIKKLNEEVSLDIEPITIRMQAPQGVPKKDRGYTMEDLEEELSKNGR